MAHIQATGARAIDAAGLAHLPLQSAQAWLAFLSNLSRSCTLYILKGLKQVHKPPAWGLPCHLRAASGGGCGSTARSTPAAAERQSGVPVSATRAQRTPNSNVYCGARHETLMMFSNNFQHGYPHYTCLHSYRYYTPWRALPCAWVFNATLAPLGCLSWPSYTLYLMGTCMGTASSNVLCTQHTAPSCPTVS